MTLDIHSHRAAPYPEGVVSLLTPREPLLEGQLYSVGIHPWATPTLVDEDTFHELEHTASRREVVAIGECGVDLLKGGPLFRQLQVFKRQVELSESLRKPLVIHCVKAADIMMGLRRDLEPSQPWIIHGFRGKPELARQLVDKGFHISFGEKFNPDTVMAVPGDRILAETDESVLPIGEIVAALGDAAGRDLLPDIAANTAAVLRLDSQKPIF